MTKEEAWLLWMKESKHYVEYDWDTIKKSSHWEAFSRGWDAASVNANGWDDAYKMGLEAGRDIEKYTLNRQGEWQWLTDEERLALWNGIECDLECLKPAQYARAIEQALKEKTHDG